MTTHALYLESGPKRRKTMVHVPALLGCVAVGPTTDEALAATPDAIRAYLRFLRRHGEAADPEASIDLVVAEHITEGEWLGNGSPYVVFATDLLPLADRELASALRRFGWMRDEVSAWVTTRADADLDAEPDGGGRTVRAILLHILATPGAYLAAALGGANPVSGYTLIEAGSLDEAVAAAKRNPLLAGSGSIEVAETFTMG